MQPAFSVIFFTVASGIGYGFFCVLGAVGIFFHLEDELVILGGTIATILITLGLISSTGHLANRKNAWRAFSRFRTSWLSREGVLAILFYPLVFLYGVSFMQGQGSQGSWLWVILSALLVATAGAIIFSTGMIYACLKTIRQWNTPLTPTNYLLFALLHGQLLFLSVQGMLVPVANLFLSILFGLVLLFIGLVMKAIYYVWITPPSGSTINTATGLTNATVRLLDVGHTAGNFLTEEFGYNLLPRLRTMLRIVVFIFCFIVPALILAGVLGGYCEELCVVFALLLSVAGMLVERWLFFAEACHVINLYHGAPHT